MDLAEALQANRTSLAADATRATGLSNAMYRDPAILTLERERIFRAQWLAVGHAADIARPGDAMPVEAAGVPIILLRGRDGTLRAFHNVCGHRGLRLLDAPCHGRPTLVCPYHGWAYDLAGLLRATPDFGGIGRRDAPGFDPTQFELRPVRLAEAFGGLLFVNLSGTAPPFADWAGPLLARWRPYDFDRLAHAHTETCTVDANWKLVAENFVDTLHLEWVHPQVVGHSRPEDHFDIIEPPAYCSATRSAFSGDPRARAIPSFPDLPADLANRGEFLLLYPNVLFFLMPNQLFSITLDATAADTTAERLDFSFVASDGAADARQWWIDGWRHLNSQDFGILARLQRGRASPAFDGGCFSAVMDQVALAVQRRVLDDLAGPP